MSNKTDKLILVSAGHTNVAGQDRGAAGNEFIEGVLTVELRDAVAAELRARGISVIEDGADGVSEPLNKAIVLARRANTAVEFHWNAGPKTATGIEVLSKPGKKVLAKKLAKAMHDATGLKLRGDAGWKADNSGQHHRLAFCEAGGLIVEVCFISNGTDMDAYHDNFDKIVRNLAAVLAGESYKVPSVEAEKVENSSEQNPLSNILPPSLPTDSTVISDLNSAQSLAEISTTSEGPGAVAPDSGLSEKFDGTVEKVSKLQDKLDAVNNVVARFSSLDTAKSLWAAASGKVIRFALFIGAWFMGVPMKYWAIVAGLIFVGSMAYLLFIKFLRKHAAPPTPLPESPASPTT